MGLCQVVHYLFLSLHCTIISLYDVIPHSSQEVRGLDTSWSGTRIFIMSNFCTTPKGIILATTCLCGELWLLEEWWWISTLLYKPQLANFFKKILVPFGVAQEFFIYYATITIDKDSNNWQARAWQSSIYIYIYIYICFFDELQSSIYATLIST